MVDVHKFKIICFTVKNTKRYLNISSDVCSSINQLVPKFGCFFKAIYISVLLECFGGNGLHSGTLQKAKGGLI